jgi:purine-cytosine permease-like protein
MNNIMPLLSGAAIMVIAILIAGTLIRQRNKLHARFGRQEGIHHVIELGSGMRIAIVEIDGHRIACAIGKYGVTAMQTLSTTNKAETP